MHARLATAPGDRGCLTLYGGKPEEHRLFAEHPEGSGPRRGSQRRDMEGRSIPVRRERLKPAKPDNRWFDCLVGCAVGASMCRVLLGTEREATAPRKRVKLSDLQTRRRK